MQSVIRAGRSAAAEDQDSAFSVTLSDLVSAMIRFEPRERITIEKAIEHDFFRTVGRETSSVAAIDSSAADFFGGDGTSAAAGGAEPTAVLSTATGARWDC